MMCPKQRRTKPVHRCPDPRNLLTDKYLEELRGHGLRGLRKAFKYLPD